MKRTLLATAVAATLFASAPASAIVALVLNGPINGSDLGPQSTSNPCVIAATQCQQPFGFGFNNFVQGGTSAIDAYSTNTTQALPDGLPGNPYTVAQLLSVVGQTFIVDIDINTTSANTEVLQLFQVIINGVVQFAFNGPASVAPVFQNGNGFGDFSLGIINLAGFAPTDQVLFRMVMTGLVDGGESAWLQPVNTTPEPGTLALAGLALAGVGFTLKRRI